MKIGILSMQRVINYGSFLQAYALKHTIENQGHKCSFIDIKPGRKIGVKINNTEKQNPLRKVDKYIINRIKHKFFRKKRNKRFNCEFFPLLGMTTEQDYNSDYDTVVIGSDEVFNCARYTNWGFAKTLIGEGLESNKVITYAASCGHTTLEKLNNYGIKSEVADALGNVGSFSVRDENTKDFVETLTDKETIENIDPVLIYDFKDVVPTVIPEKNYILVYAYDNRINDQETISKVKEIAKKYNKKIISVGFYQNWVDKNVLCNPFELLAYFRDADFIVTDTFHGTIFSIKYNKQFATIVRDSNKQKLGYLLKKFQLTSQEVKNINNLETIINQTPDFTIVNSILSDETKKSINYLRENI